MRPPGRLLNFLVPLVFLANFVSAAPRVVLCCSERNDLYVALGGVKSGIPRFEGAAQAVERAPEGTGVLVLAEGYPAERTALDEEFFATAEKKRLRLYV